MRKNNGFSLIEILLVLLILGLMTGTVVINFLGPEAKDKLEEQARRFQVIVGMASDLAVLNQLQLGLRIEPDEQKYIFMFLDDQNRWQPLEQQAIFEPFTLPDAFTLALELDNLPWVDEDNFFDTDLFGDDEGFKIERDIEVGDEPPPLPPPQILLLSSGEITPFSLIFKFEPNFSNEDPVYFRVNAQDYAPLIIEGPLEFL